MLQLLRLVVLVAQVRLERAPEQLEQDLKADLGDGWVVAALTELVADEGVLRPGELVEAEHDTVLAQLLPDQVPACVGHVCVFDAENQGRLGLGLVQEVDGVVAVGRGLGRCVGGVVGTQRTAVDVRGEVGDAGVHARVKLSRVLDTCRYLSLM